MQARIRPAATALALAAGLALTLPAVADETCQSPYLPKITGQEDFVHIWTLGVEGLGDGSDKLVTVGANPARDDYGKVVSSVSVGGRHEAHHGGFTDDRRQFWAGGLDDSMIYVFDVATDPANPTLLKTIDDFVEKTGGVVGPHTFYALPGRVLITALSNKEGTGKTAMAEYNNDGEYIRTMWFPDDAVYGYDVRIKAELNRMLTSSFTGKKNYMRKLSELLGDAEAMKNFGSTMVVWDYHTRKPLQTLAGPRSPAGESGGRCSRTTTTRSPARPSPRSSVDHLPQGRTGRSRRSRWPTSAIPRQGSAARRHQRSRQTTASSSSTASWTGCCGSSTYPSPGRRSWSTRRRSAPR